MAPHRDQQLDRLLARRDPVDRSLLCHGEVAAALEQLRQAIVTEAPGARGRWRRPRPRLALSAALVGALAAALLVVGALLPAGGVRDAQLGPAPATAAARVLERVAGAAARQPEIYPTTRQYQYVAVEEGTISGFGEGAQTGPPGTNLWGVNLWQSDTKQDWFKPNGSGRERIIETGRGFLTPLDRTIARAHGRSLDSLLPSQSVDGIYPAGGIGWSYLIPADLPTESTRLLLQAVVHEMRARSIGRQPAAADVFDALGELLFVSNSSAQRAALYRVLAHLPGVHLLGRAVDREGRRGLAVAITRAVPRGAPDLRDELLFDPTTSEVLQQENSLVEPFHQSETPTLPAGTVMGYTVFVARGIVDSITALPGGGQLPYHPSIGPGTR